MKLMREFIDFEKMQVLTEDDVSTTSGAPIKQRLKLKGPFLEAETKNRNGRIYPIGVLQKEVLRYDTEMIKTKRALGELNHGLQPEIVLDRVSHIIEDLRMDGNIGIGVARILEDVPMGRIAAALVREGVVLGMSTRGIGSLKGDVVEEGFLLLSVDIVFSPSAPNAFVEGVLESKEYIMQGDRIVEMAVEQLQKDVDNKYTSNNSQQNLQYMLKFIQSIKRNAK